MINIPDQMGCVIKPKTGTYNCYTLTFKGMTRGSILSMKNALELWAKHSAVANDVLSFLKNGIKESNDAELKSSCPEG